VVELTTAVDDLSRRLDVYTDQLFRQARWELESLRSEVLSDLKIDRVLPLTERALNSAERAVAAADRLVPAVERTLSVVEGAPKLVVGERDAVLKAVQDELTRTIKFVREERVAALDSLTNERAAALGHLTSERIATLDYLTKERSAAFNEIRATVAEERKAATRDVEHMSLKVLDHAFWRAAQLLMGLVVALFVALAVAFVALRRARPRLATTR
jgi:hypothetical protein